MATDAVRVVVISEKAKERQQLTQLVDSLPGLQIVAEVDLVCQMGRQAGNADADCVVLDIDRYPLAGTLGLAQAKATFPDASILILARAVPPRFLQYLKASGASCCIDKDDPDMQAHLINGCQPLIGVPSGSAAACYIRSGWRGPSPM